MTVFSAAEARVRRYGELQGEARTFPGASELLRRVHGEGLVVVLATSSPRDELHAMIELLDVGDAIDAVTSSDDVDNSKPEPDVFEAALQAGSVDRERTVVVGDSVCDIQAARAAGLATLGVESGGFSRHELSEQGALHVYRDVQEILDQFHTGPLGSLKPQQWH